MPVMQKEAGGMTAVGSSTGTNVIEAVNVTLIIDAHIVEAGIMDSTIVENSYKKVEVTVEVTEAVTSTTKNEATAHINDKSVPAV